MNTSILSVAGHLIAAVLLACALSARAQDPHGTISNKECLKPAAWYTLAGDAPRPVNGNDLIADMAARDAVLLGETHDNFDHHEWQLQTLAALHLLRPQMVIGFESFPRRVQPALDKWVAGQISVKQFLEQSEWSTVWRMSADLYLPLFRFARINRIPMVALNVDQSLIDAVTKTGWDAVSQEQREGLSRPAPPSKSYRDFLFEVFNQHQQSKNKGSGDFGFFVQSQTTWDRAMAEALARRVDSGGGEQRPLVVGIMGSGHIRYGFGVPYQLRDLGVSNIGTLIPVDTKEDCDDIKRGFADAVFAIPTVAMDRPPPPRLGVQLEQVDGGARLVQVRSGSLAEKMGLRRGDVITSVAGAPVDRMSKVISAVQQQPAGTWLPMKIRRGAETLDIVVKFPR